MKNGKWTRNAILTCVSSLFSCVRNTFLAQTGSRLHGDSDGGPDHVYLCLLIETFSCLCGVCHGDYGPCHGDDL